ncbi:MAG: hypothetical protein ABII64_09570 [Elusimicrobiota bacterium]
MKKTFITLMLLFAVSCRLPAFDRSNPVYKWFESQQLSNGLVPSQENGRMCFTYDQALAIFIFTLADDYARAEKLLDFLVQKAGKTEFIGFPDMYGDKGMVGSSIRAAGPNPWLLLAINYYTKKTGKTEYVSLGKKIADWLLTLQREDGGISGGYDDMGNPFPWVSAEHNFNCYSALTELSEISKKNKYKAAAADIRKFIEKELWVPREGRFYNGYKDFNFALDVASWGVLSLGKKYSAALDFAMQKARCTKKYSEMGVEVDGFDFGGPYRNTHFPDLDSVWFEGMGQMVVAFQLVGREKDAEYFMQELKKCLTDSKVFPGTKGLPYASNPGTPPYGGWMMFSDKLCVSSGVWYLFAIERFNPYTGKKI